MIYTIEWRANGTNTWPINQSVTSPLGPLSAPFVDRVQGYTLPAGTYSYFATAQHDNNYWNDIKLYDSAGNEITTVTTSIGNWQAGSYRGSFTLAQQTTIYGKTGDAYYEYNTRLTLTVYDSNSFLIEWRTPGNNTFPINQAVTIPLDPINTTYSGPYNQVEGYTLPAGTYNFTASSENDSNYYNSITLNDASGNVLDLITEYTYPWSPGPGPYSGTFTLAHTTTIYANFSDNYYMYNTNLNIHLTRLDVPSTPTALSWTDTYNGSVSVSFTQGSNGGSAITNYRYSLDGGSSFSAFNPAQTSSPLSITGLSNRTNYSLVIEAVNAVGNSAPTSPLSLYYMCFLEGTKILCFNSETQQEEYRAIETLRKGDLVKTFSNGYKPIDTIGTSKIYNPANSMRSLNRLYRCSKENYPSLTEDLVITGCHSILVKNITEEERNTLLDLQGKIYVTEKHYRLIATADQKAVPYEHEGFFNIWHIALEHPQYTFNYGVYANGLLVETSSMRMMRELSGMDLIQ